MRQRLARLTKTVEMAASSLTKQYRPKQLHSLRVAIRRIRSILKQDDHLRSSRFRKTWSAFAALTNDARDWDVFLLSSRKLLTDGEYRVFSRLNLARVEASQEAVKLMLQSENWSLFLHEWKKFLECPKVAAEAQSRPRNRYTKPLEQALFAATLALARALETDDDSAWHKFRIAVKDVRYIAQASKSRAKRVREAIVTCKSLQALLGNWHDRAVQLQLLDTLGSVGVHAKLRPLISQDKTHLLSQIRLILLDQSVFVAAGELDTRC